MVGTLICLGILILLVGILELLAFFIGVKVAQKVNKNEDIELPTMNPIKAYHEHQEQKVNQEEQERLEKIKQNIDNYDGTSLGQLDIK
jgi:cell division protein FtsB